MPVTVPLILPCPMEAKEIWTRSPALNVGVISVGDLIVYLHDSFSQTPPVTIITPHCTALSTVGGNWPSRVYSRNTRHTVDGGMLTSGMERPSHVHPLSDLTPTPILHSTVP